MLPIVKDLLEFVGTKKLSAYFVIRNNSITAFNGVEVKTFAPFPCEIDCAPKARAFYRALKKRKGPVALWLTGMDGCAENLCIQSGDFLIEVECADLALFPDPIPAGEWFNTPKPKKAPKPKAQPPEPVWLSPDYLPGLEEARAFDLPQFTVDELVAACNAREPLVCDCEIFPNYFLIAFRSVESGKVIYFEMNGDLSVDFDDENLRWILNHFLIITFNGNLFDLPMIALALAGKSCEQIKKAADDIIVLQIKPWQVLKSAKVKKLKIDHIDLIEVCPLDGSLKIYGGRLHTPKMQDLPFPPDTVLSPEQTDIVRWYCVDGDLTATAFCYENLKEQIGLRVAMSEKYGHDLRSKSDAQIAEAVITGELQRINFVPVERPEFVPGAKFFYKKPDFINFKTPEMQEVLATICGWEFWVGDSGYVSLPIDPAKKLKDGKPRSIDFEVRIGNGVYTMGMGGLHSQETSVCHKADQTTLLFDRDVASYYPAIILNLGLYPRHLGPEFLQVYKSIVDRRLQAKKDKNKIEAEMLKIVVNGSFGKFGSMWSALYSPDLLMTVTITGQLCLLMLIEALELAGIPVVSANTDGVMVACPAEYRGTMLNVFKGWEYQTYFKTEETEYSAIYSRDVNNYIAVKTDGKTKTKGAYFSPWSYPEYNYERFKKNPVCTVVVESVIAYLSKGIPFLDTIENEKDFTKFLAIRTVKGGGVKDGRYLGKAVRWYYAERETGVIVYAKTGNKVPESDGARPCMELPDEFPQDINYSYYEREAEKILEEVGLLKNN